MRIKRTLRENLADGDPEIRVRIRATSIGDMLKDGRVTEEDIVEYINELPEVDGVLNDIEVIPDGSDWIVLVAHPSYQEEQKALDWLSQNHENDVFAGKFYDAMTHLDERKKAIEDQRLKEEWDALPEDERQRRTAEKQQQEDAQKRAEWEDRARQLADDYFAGCRSIGFDTSDYRGGHAFPDNLSLWIAQNLCASYHIGTDTLAESINFAVRENEKKYYPEETERN